MKNGPILFYLISYHSFDSHYICFAQRIWQIILNNFLVSLFYINMIDIYYDLHDALP